MKKEMTYGSRLQHGDEVRQQFTCQEVRIHDVTIRE